MRRSRFYIFGFIALVLGLVSLDLYVYQKWSEKFLGANANTVRIDKKNAVHSEIENQRNDQSNTQSNNQTDSQTAAASQEGAQARSAASAAASELPVAADLQLTAEFKEQLSAELALIGKIQSSPQDVAEIEKRLSSFARHLSEAEINYLAYLVQNTEVTGDLKALALDLLGRNQSSEALTALKNFALQPTERNGFSPLPMQIRREMEAMQAMAVEELASARTSFEAVRHLEEIRQKTANSFLRDRADRSLLALKGSVPSIQSQDQKALEELIQ